MIRCAIYRGGTSKGVMFRENDLPSSPDDRSKILLRIMGSPDLKQIDGLGAATLQVSQLARLRAGDLVILDQPVVSPMAAYVAGEARFLVWPGRVGPKQAFQIASLVEC